MARIRTIKPEFWTSEQVTECSLSARLLFIGMWNFADDGGNLAASVKTAKMQIFPADNIDIAPLVHELLSVGLLVEYHVNGRNYWHITGWKHQQINRPSPLKHPQFNEHSVSAHVSLSEHSLEERKGRERKGKDISSSLRSDDMPREPSALAILSECLSMQTAKDLIAHRQKLRKPLTARAAKLLAKDFVAYGKPEEAAEMMIKNGWQGFHPTWVANQTARAGPPANGRGGMASLLAKSLGLKNGRESRDTDEAVHVLPVYDRVERGNVSDDGSQLPGDIIDLLAVDTRRGM